LGDQEVIEEEEILDMGLATQEDISKMIHGVELEMLDIHPNLIGVLRHLCGVDLIRHQEVYYVLKPGETRESIVKNPKKLDQKAKHRASRDFTAETPTVAFAGSPSGASVRSSGHSSVKPPSVAGSTSTSRSVARRLMTTDKDSVASASDNDGDGGEKLNTKRRKTSRPPSLSRKPESTSSKTGSDISKPRKSRKLPKDAEAYEPATEGSVVDTQSDEEGQKTKRRKRGLKRARTSGVAPEDDTKGETSRQSKRLKTRASMPATQP
jgi:hypothetical protein